MVAISNILPFAALAATTFSTPMKRDPVTWTLHGVSYNQQVTYSTPSHRAKSIGNVEFSLSSTAVPYTTHCQASSNNAEGFFYGTRGIVYTCAPSEGATGETSFTYDRGSGEFTVRQTWAQDGVTHLGEGAGSVNLECHDNSWYNPNWTPGQDYSTLSVDCQPADLTITPTVGTQ